MQVTLTQLSAQDFTSPLGLSLTRVFHQAFNSKPHWSVAEWPLGNPDEVGTVSHTVSVFASRGYRASIIHLGARVLSFVISGLLTEDCNRDYRLAEFGGRAGDGFIPFIGVDPEYRSFRVQTSCLGQGSSGGLTLVQLGPEQNGGTRSLIRTVFDDALQGLDAQVACTWSRTRSVLKPVQAIFSDSGFEEVGRFDYLHRGKDPQDRIVYRRMRN